VYFSVVIDRASVLPGIVRTLRTGWRTIRTHPHMYPRSFVLLDDGRRCMSKIWSSHSHRSLKTMNISQEMISHVLVCKFHTLCRTTRLRNESCCSCRDTSTTLPKRNLLNVSETHEKFFLNRCVIQYYAIFSGHIGDRYREIQETGPVSGLNNNIINL
jgi:hypothetical protein